MFTDANNKRKSSSQATPAPRWDTFWPIYLLRCWREKIFYLNFKWGQEFVWEISRDSGFGFPDFRTELYRGSSRLVAGDAGIIISSSSFRFSLLWKWRCNQPTDDDEKKRTQDYCNWVLKIHLLNLCRLGGFVKQRFLNQRKSHMQCVPIGLEFQFYSKTFALSKKWRLILLQYQPLEFVIMEVNKTVVS